VRIPGIYRADSDSTTGDPRHFERLRFDRLRRDRHQDYIKLIVALLPKEIRIREIEIPEMPDDEFEEMFEALKTVAKMKGMEEAEIKAIVDCTDIAESQ